MSQEEINKPVARRGALRESEFVEMWEVRVQQRMVESGVFGDPEGEPLALGVPLLNWYHWPFQLANYPKQGKAPCPITSWN